MQVTMVGFTIMLILLNAITCITEVDSRVEGG